MEHGDNLKREREKKKIYEKKKKTSHALKIPGINDRKN